MDINKQIADYENLSEDFEDSEDVLSLSNYLPFHGPEQDDYSGTCRPGNSSDQDVFEFFNGFDSQFSFQQGVVFCGKEMIDLEEDELNEFRKRDYLCLKSASFHKPSGFLIYRGTENLAEFEERSILMRYSKQSNSAAEPVRKVNLTAITSMSAKSRRRMFMFGPMKFKPEMDVGAIRKRQGRSRKIQIPPMPEESGGDMVVKRGGDGRNGGQLAAGLTRPLRCRSHFAAALAKSFGCISASVV